MRKDRLRTLFFFAERGGDRPCCKTWRPCIQIAVFRRETQAKAFCRGITMPSAVGKRRRRRRRKIPENGDIHGRRVAPCLPAGAGGKAHGLRNGGRCSGRPPGRMHGGPGDAQAGKVKTRPGRSLRRNVEMLHCSARTVKKCARHKPAPRGRAECAAFRINGRAKLRQLPRALSHRAASGRPAFSRPRPALRRGRRPFVFCPSVGMQP